MAKKIQGYNLSNYDFMDFGSGTGGSIPYCKKRFGAKDGIGVDIRLRHVEAARDNGIDTIHADIMELPVKSAFKFVSMMDFLEHLPGKQASKNMIRKASELATDFLFIRHPSFEDMEYLAEIGYKVTWYDWKGHTSLMTIVDYAKTFDELGLKQYCFNFRKPIKDTSSEFIVPLDAPVDTVKYSEKSHGKKKDEKFKKTIYGQIDIFVALKSFSQKEWNAITKDDEKR